MMTVWIIVCILIVISGIAILVDTVLDRLSDIDKNLSDISRFLQNIDSEDLLVSLRDIKNSINNNRWK